MSFLFSSWSAGDPVYDVTGSLLVGWTDATYDFDVAPAQSYWLSFFDDDPTNDGTFVDVPQALLFNPLSRGDKVITGFDPDDHVLRFDLMPDYFGQWFVGIDSAEDFTDLLNHVADIGASKGGGMNYVTVYDGDVIVNIDADDCWLGDLNLTFEDLAATVDLSDVLTVIDFDEFALADGAEASLPELNGGSTVYEGFTWSQLGIFNPAGESQIGYDPASQPNTGFIGEKDLVDRAAYDAYDAPAGAPLEISSADEFSFVSAAFNSVTWETSVVTLELTVQAFVDGIADAVGELAFTVNNQGVQDVVEFSDPDDGQRFENINRLVIDANGYFGIDDFTFV